MAWRTVRADIIRIIGGSRAELDALSWEELTREWIAARHMVMGG